MHLRAFLLLLVAGCPPVEEADACHLPNGFGCAECFSGWYTCAYEGVEATAASCEGCQARWAVIDELCAQGNTDSLEAIEAGTVCVEVDEP
jgi:hypothetical protein